MNVLITAGGTTEKIDEVRNIGNWSTGRLGSLIADAFLESDGISVTYLCSQNAARPQNPRARILPIGNVHSLLDGVEKEMRTTTYDAVVHSMAVSDYTVKYSVSSETLAARLAESLQGTDYNKETLTEQIHSALLHCGSQSHSGKISSDINNLVLCLEKTPKVIGRFKMLQPKTILVGFKLLVGVEEKELLQVAEHLLNRNGCDFVLANDKKNIDETHHGAILLGNDHSKIRLSTKQEIAEAIKRSVMRKIQEDKQG